MKAQALVAWNLRRLRVGRGLSQENLAVDARIDRTYVSRLERGLENPTVALLEQLAFALEAEIADFFVVPGPDEPPPRPLPSGRRPSVRRRVQEADRIRGSEWRGCPGALGFTARSIYCLSRLAD
jgi:transcriptional regulator with XRE-family HTH domain